MANSDVVLTLAMFRLTSITLFHHPRREIMKRTLIGLVTFAFALVLLILGLQNTNPARGMGQNTNSVRGMGQNANSARSTGTSKSKSNASGTSLDQIIITKSKETSEAYKSKNIAAIKALTAEDYAAYTLAGPSNLQQDIATIDKLTIENYTLDDPKVSMPAKNVAILRYKCDLKGSFDGKPFRPVYATEVWVNRGGKWQIVSYSETPVS
jgi:ketosteroid isomerase-like protein